MRLVHNETLVHNAMGFVDSEIGAQWERYTMKLALSAPGTQWDRYTIGLVHCEPPLWEML